MVARDAVKIAEAPADSPLLPEAAGWLNRQWDLGYTVAETLSWCRDLARAEDEAVLLAKAGERLLGIAVLTLCDLEARRDLSPWLSSLFVAPAWRKRGLGERLIAGVESAARQRGHGRLYAYAENGRLVAYYRRLGWRALQPLRVDGEDFVLLSKHISQTP